MTTNLKVENVSNTVKFYSDVLKFKVVAMLPEKEPIWALLSKDSANIMFQQSKSFEQEDLHDEKN